MYHNFRATEPVKNVEINEGFLNSAVFILQSAKWNDDVTGNVARNDKRLFNLTKMAASLFTSDFSNGVLYSK